MSEKETCACGQSAYAIKAVAIPSSALILVNEAHVRLFVSQILVQIGVKTIYEAADADEGLRLFNERKPGLIWIDSRLGRGVSGLETLKRIRAQDEYVYTVLFSGEASSASVMAALDAGADGFIRKDTAPAEIARQLLEIVADPEDEDGSEAP